MEIRVVETEKEYRNIVSCNKNVLVKFSSSWCGPCKLLGNMIKGINSEIFNNIVLFEVDTDNEEMDGICVENRIKSIPTLLFYVDGNVVDRTVGTLSETELENKLKNIFG